jgi:hypothetical protein
MSDELKLPDDLRACEARLARQPLPPSRIDRDELLYRAGWAAARAQAAGNRAVIPQPAAPRRTIAAWSLASAALAASLAAAATHMVLSTEATRTPTSRSAASPPQVADARASSVDLPATTRDRDGSSAVPRIDALAAHLSFVQNRPPAALLAASRARAGRWDEPVLVAASADGSVAAPSDNVTAQMLLDELVPSDSTQDPERGAPTGMFQLLRPLAWGDDAI